MALPQSAYRLLGAVSAAVFAAAFAAGVFESLRSRSRLPPLELEPRAHVKIMMDRGEAERAVRELEGLLRVERARFDTLVRLGRALSRLDRTEEAAARYAAAIRLKPDAVDARHLLAAELVELERFEEAAEQYGALLERQPDDPGLYTNLGAVLEFAGNPGAAIRVYERALVLDPDFFEANFNLGRARLAQGQFALAVESLEAAARQRESARGRALLARAYAGAGRSQHAIASYRRAVDLEPSEPTFRRGLAELLRESGRGAEALRSGCAELRLGQGRAYSLVLIVNDTMRRDRVGAYGGPAATPVFDAFARDHLLFRRAVTQAPWTKPAIASLFTGLYPSQHGVLDDPRLPQGRQRDAQRAAVLGEELETLAEVMHAASFRTAAFVGNPWLGRAFGFAQGFEVYDDSFARFGARGDVVTRAGLDWLEGLEPGERFLLYLHYMDSHLPYGRLEVEDVAAARARLDADTRPVPAEAAEALAGLRTPDGQSLVNAASVPPSRALLELAYDRGLSDFDRALGDLLAALRERPDFDRTAVIVTSDHGEALYERGYGNHARALHDDELAVPLAARLPGVTSADGGVDCAAGLIDLLPTLCAYFDLPCPSASGIALLAAPGAPSPAPRYLAAEGVPGFRKHRAIRGRRYKLLFEPGGPLGENLSRDRRRGRAQPYSIYDLRVDPGEQRDLLAQGAPPPEVEALLEALRPALGAVIPDVARAEPDRIPIDPDLRRRLEELGYGADPAP